MLLEAEEEELLAAAARADEWGAAAEPADGGGAAAAAVGLLLATVLQPFHSWFHGQLLRLQRPGAELAAQLGVIKWAAQYEAQLAHYLPRLPADGRAPVLRPPVTQTTAASVAGFAAECGRHTAAWLEQIDKVARLEQAAAEAVRGSGLFLGTSYPASPL